MEPRRRHLGSRHQQNQRQVCPQPISDSVWGGEWDCGIGAAVADKPEGPFIDHGPLFRSKEIGVQNSIDQFYIEDNGHKYLFWGSFHGIWGVELSDDGLSVKPGAQKFRMAASNFMEGTYIHKHGRLLLPLRLQRLML